MASLNSEIVIRCEKRACYVDGKKAFFHRWSEVKRVVKGFCLAETFGIVEFEDGAVREVYPADITFADGGDFGDYVFLPQDRVDGRDEVSE